MPYTIQSIRSKLFLTRSLAQVTIQQNRPHNEHQVWEILKMKEDYILIKEESTHTYLTTPGIEEQQVTVAPFDSNNDFQKWFQQSSDDGSCLLLCHYNHNSCLDVLKQSKEENTPVVESSIKAAQNKKGEDQRWIVLPI